MWRLGNWVRVGWERVLRLESGKLEMRGINVFKGLGLGKYWVLGFSLFFCVNGLRGLCNWAKGMIGL